MPVEIPLTKGFVALVDEADAERVLLHLTPDAPAPPTTTEQLATLIALITAQYPSERAQLTRLLVEFAAEIERRARA